jgi:hypothetical protein
MSQYQYKTKEFKDLQSEWYDKLNREGFKDVEQDEYRMKQWDCHAFSSRYTPQYFYSGQKYFALASQFLHSYKFKNDFEKLLWEHHAQGLSIRDIHKVIPKPSKSASTIFYVIQRLAKEMLIQYAADDEND